MIQIRFDGYVLSRATGSAAPQTAPQMTVSLQPVKRVDKLSDGKLAGLDPISDGLLTGARKVWFLLLRRGVLTCAILQTNSEDFSSWALLPTA